MKYKKDLVSIILNCFNGGEYLKEALISIQNQTYKNWELIFWDNRSKDNSKEILSPETAYQVTSLLEGVIKRGTGRRLKKLNLPLAGKTGTTNNNMDAWFIGFTSNLVIGVYVGFDEPKTLGKYETGAKAALPILRRLGRPNQLMSIIACSLTTLPKTYPEKFRQ